MKIWGAAVEFEVLFKLGGVAVGVESDQVVPRGQLVPSVIGFQGFAVLELDVVSIRRLVIEFGRLPYILDAGQTTKCSVDSAPAMSTPPPSAK